MPWVDSPLHLPSPQLVYPLPVWNEVREREGLRRVERFPLERTWRWREIDGFYVFEYGPRQLWQLWVVLRAGEHLRLVWVLDSPADGGWLWMG